MSHAHTTQRNAAWRKQRHVLECRDGELVALLSLTTGRYHTLNPLGAFVWERLEAPIELAHLVHQVASAFDAGSADVADDIASLLCELRAHGLVTDADDDETADGGREPSSLLAGRSRALSTSTAAIAWALTRIRVRLRSGGVARAARFAYRGRLGAAAPSDAEAVRLVVERVNRAATLVPFRAECLERSLTIVHVLRSAGIDAKLRLAIRHYPFEAHAWAEHNGVALNECDAVCALFTPFPALELEMLPCGR